MEGDEDLLRMVMSRLGDRLEAKMGVRLPGSAAAAALMNGLPANEASVVARLAGFPGV